ncbi:GAF and ANTAR domain-containing protein [Streptomyces sp. CRN 30]|uniref:GAF and ANTAR domain-containing protein n=1 Tax=Streptomyces sp. CRN 30 TaxID=3075613 RepID=UPI002A800F3B|nr:GAF and ANTAR domain-containing protein [Streptomyces sp. CRN 30]
MEWRTFAGQLATMARDLLAQETVDATLERITGSAVELVEGCDAAGVLVLRGRQVSTLAATEQVVVDSDRMQERAGEGPCFDAARRAGGRRVFRIADFGGEAAHWPDYLSYARGLGLGSMMGFLLFTEDEDLGALNLYSRAPGAFGAVSETAGGLLASHAAVAFASARTGAQMREALATRHAIGEAMGILMGRHGLTEEQAFGVLRAYSQETNVKLRQVADRVCADGGPGG